MWTIHFKKSFPQFFQPFSVRILVLLQMQTEIQLSSRHSNQDRASPFPVSTATLGAQLSLANKMDGGMDSHSADVRDEY